MKKRFATRAVLALILSAGLLFSACGGSNTGNLTINNRGNTDSNINNLGLAAAKDHTIYYTGTETEYDLIYEADENGEPQKALTGITGYIQFLNVMDDTIYFLGITYDSNETRTEAIFSVGLDGQEQNSIYTMKAGESTSYLTAADDLLIYVTTNEKERSKIGAINAKAETEATLLTENAPIRSLNIYEDKLYYICENTVYRASLDGKEKTKLFSADRWIGNMAINDDQIYLTRAGETENANDELCSLPINSENIEVIYNDAKRISTINTDGFALYFTADTYDGEGKRIETKIYRWDTDSEETTTLTTITDDYIDMEICNELLIYHINDNHNTIKTIPLPEA